MGLTALDLGLRGAAVGLSLLVCALLLRDWPFLVLTKLRIALGAGAIAYAVSTAPFFPRGSFGWNVPFVIVYSGSPVVFWLWALAVFNDKFGLRLYHIVSWVFVATLGLFAYCGGATSAVLAAESGRLFALSSAAFAILAALQTMTIWRADLFAGRRRLLIASLLITTAFVVVNAASGFAAIPWTSVSFSHALGLGMLALLGVWTSFPEFASQVAVTSNAATGRGAPKGEVRVYPAVSMPNQALQRRLEYLMTSERAYRQEGLTIGMLAIKLGTAEHRLRTLINGRLGHRNFNAFLNRYRIDEAKAALADPLQMDVPILTIALDAGFQSIAPFNRAFKGDTGLTPTEFRRRALAESQTRDGD